jgi:hypothetical protein
MLGVVAEHYTGASATEEIARWREAYGGLLDPLVQAIDDCPFVTPRIALRQAARDRWLADLPVCFAAWVTAR